MITGELKNKVDAIWDVLWTAGITNPLTVVEQVTYLLFMKMLDDAQRKKEADAAYFGAAVADPVFKEGVCTISTEPPLSASYSDLRWSVFRNFAPDKLYATISTYAFPFIKGLGSRKDTAFSRFMKDATFLVPTPRVLADVVGKIDGLDLTDKDIMGDVYEYLLGKLAAAGQNGQFRTPRHIIAMIVRLVKPTLKDRIVDPAMGSAGFLVESAAYLERTYPKELLKKDVRARFRSETFTGFDTDRSMLRIGAMNMMLHGVDDPRIRYQDSLSDENTERGVYSLVLANPPFTGSLFKDSVAKDLLALCKTGKTELLFAALFTKILRVGGRCAQIVPDGVLFGSSSAHKALRRELVDRQRLEAVLSMPSGVFKPYAGVSTAVLLFTKTDAGGTDKVWFYDMEADGFSLDDKRTATPDKNDIPDLIARFEARNDEPNDDRAAKHFFVPRDEIAANDYDLSINKYKKVEYVAETFPPVADLLADVERLEKDVLAGIAALKEELG